MNMKDVEYGGVYLCRIVKGKTEIGYKPVIVFGSTENEIIVAPLSKASTTTDKTKKVYIPRGNGLLEDSFALVGKGRKTDPDNLVKLLYLVTDQKTIDELKASCRYKKKEKSRDMIMCLCKVCKSGFEDVPGIRVVKSRKGSRYKDACTYCGIRFGFEYRLIRK